ncbi:MAG: hypothetical protein R3236_02150 [Phycisphaeraceae bacterium]|nr:hypothetical protein [Phycisphaeraceae bacterium]
MDQETKNQTPEQEPQNQADASAASDSTTAPESDKGTLLVVALCGLVALVGLIMMMNGKEKGEGEGDAKNAKPELVSSNEKKNGNGEADKPDDPKKQTQNGGTGVTNGHSKSGGEDGPLEVVKVDTAELEQMKLELPYPAFEGTPKNDKNKVNIDPARRGKKRKPYVVPKGLVNIAAKMKVASSDNPFIGSLDMVTDGDKDPLEGAFVELTSGKQWVQLDLKKPHDIFVIVFWHRHDTALVYRDVVIQLSNDPEFKKGVVTVYNNDDDNSSGFGVGRDYEYYESDEGELVAKTSGVDEEGRPIVTESLGRARYVRLWSNGNVENEYNHYTEVEVFAKPVN